MSFCSYQEALNEFENTFGTFQELQAWVELRKALIMEEAKEVCQALDNYGATYSTDHTGSYLITQAELMKELVDLFYVTMGTFVGTTFDISFKDVFDEVHRSNMSKTDVDGKALYREDGKLLKGPNYSPANVLSIIEKGEAE